MYYPRILILVFFVFSSSEGVTHWNVSYGSNSYQLMNVHFPKTFDDVGASGENMSFKMILLLHGGRWKGGFKEMMTPYIDWLSRDLESIILVNMDYRLGKLSSPGYPKQLNDIRKALKFLPSYLAGFGVELSNGIGLFGRSSGAHLALLYANVNNQIPFKVDVLCNIVGHTDFSDPAFLKVRTFPTTIQGLIGDYSKLNSIAKDVSPINFITPTSPSTISFYGGNDPYVPLTQGQRLREKLRSFGIHNEMYVYPHDGHKFLEKKNLKHMRKAIESFLKKYFLDASKSKCNLD